MILTPSQCTTSTRGSTGCTSTSTPPSFSLSCSCRDCAAAGSKKKPPKTVSGTCIACKRPFENAPARLPFSDGFNEWQHMSDGDGLCWRCHRLFADKRSRFSCWMMERCDRDDSVLQEFKWSQASLHLLAHKQTPFMIYLTETFKTQGFAQLLSRPNYSNDRYVTTIDRLRVDVKRDVLIRLLALVNRARLLRFTYKEMLTVPFTAHWDHRDMCEDIIDAKNRHGPLWTLAVQADQTPYPAATPKPRSAKRGPIDTKEARDMEGKQEVLA